MRCLAMTKEDNRCRRNTGPGSRLCWQHGKSDVIILADEDASTNDSPTGVNHTSNVGDLISGIERLGLENDSLQVMTTPTTPKGNSRPINEGTPNMSLIWDDGVSKLELHIGQRSARLEPASGETGWSKSTVETTPSPPPPPPPPRSRKPRVSAVSIPEDPHKVFCETPRKEIPPGIDGSLHWPLTQIMVRPADTKRGIIYVCKVRFEKQQSLEKGIIKIGRTSDIKERSTTHSRGCYPGARLQLIASYPQPKSKRDSHHQIRNCDQVEKLIHKTLERFKYDELCGCGKRHKEYFEIRSGELGDVLRHVESWVSWSEEKLGLV